MQEINKTNKFKIVIYIITTICTLAIYTFLFITRYSTLPINEIITLPISGISMPYWLLAASGFILMPAFMCAIVDTLMQKKETKN